MIGNKTERVRVLRRVRRQDENGNYDLVETLLAERWASVRPETGNERELAGQLRGVMSYSVGIDLYGVNVTSDDKVQWSTRGNLELNIQEVRLSPVRNIDTVLICDSGKPDGTTP